MAKESAVQDRPTSTTTAASITSPDGTTIGYRRLGTGPGLVILHGAMESSQSHLQLAEALAGDLTVYLPDRRGRGRPAAGPTTWCNTARPTPSSPGRRSGCRGSASTCSGVSIGAS